MAKVTKKVTKKRVKKNVERDVYKRQSTFCFKKIRNLQSMFP